MKSKEQTDMDAATLATVKRFRSPVAQLLVLKRLKEMEAKAFGKNTTQTACKNEKKRV